MPINAIGVLSRADEVAVGRLDAMASAERIAQRYRRDPGVRRLVQTVVPVAGLLAETGATLREAEFQALRQLAGVDPATTDALLLSTDRFVSPETVVTLTHMERAHLLDRTEELTDLERLLGGNGSAATRRLGLDPTAGQPDIEARAREELSRWQHRAENPLSSVELQGASRVAVRTCEGLLHPT
jgi:hypothetical protein